MVNNKMYKYTKGTPVLFTGIYNGTETNLAKYKGYYFSKGVKQKLPDGWKPSAASATTSRTASM